MAAVAGASYQETAQNMTAELEELKSLRAMLNGPPRPKQSKSADMKALTGRLEKMGAPEALLLSVPVSIGQRDAGPIEAASLTLADKLLADREAELSKVLDPWRKRAHALAGEGLATEIANLFEELQAGQAMVSCAKAEQDAAASVLKEKVKVQKAGLKRVDKVKGAKAAADALVTEASEAISAFETLNTASTSP